MKKKIFLTIITIIIIATISINNAFANYADMTDEDSNKQTQELVKEQENLHNITEVKSTDNYLNSLQVKGFTLSPEFDKQNLEYTIKEEVNTNELEIEAKASNEKAQISGIGKIKIENDKNEYRIDVTAESGTVRTYIIKFKKDKSSNTIKNEIEVDKNDIDPTQIGNEQNNNTQENNNKPNSKVGIYIAVGSFALIFIIIIVYKLRSNKNKSKRKH